MLPAGGEPSLQGTGPWKGSPDSGRDSPSSRLPITACFFRKSLHSFLVSPKASMLCVNVLEGKKHQELAPSCPQGRGDRDLPFLLEAPPAACLGLSHRSKNKWVLVSWPAAPCGSAATGVEVGGR